MQRSVEPLVLCLYGNHRVESQHEWANDLLHSPDGRTGNFFINPPSFFDRNNPDFVLTCPVHTGD